MSCDDVASHAAFKAKYGFNFPLLADIGGALAQAFGAWSGTSNTRSTFLIGVDGRITHVFPKVKVDGHVAEVFQALGGALS